MSLKLLAALKRFNESFQAVFGDADWNVTIDNIKSSNLIALGATFLEPGVSDESANWFNRGLLLHRYRILLAELRKIEEELGVI